MPLCLHMIWIILYGLTSSHFSSVAADCYFPNGKLNELYRPCNQSNEHSMCCGTGEQDRDRCRNDGLCFDAPNNDLWRGSCTDSTWKSPACIELCVEGTDQYGNLRNANGQRVTQCLDGSFCCGKGPEASQCCNLGRGIVLAISTTIPMESSSSALVGTPSFTSYWAPPTSLSLPSATTISHGDATNGVSSPTSSASSGTSPAQRPDHVVPIVAGILGSVIGVLILIGILFWLVRRRKKNAASSDSMEDSIVILDTAQTTPLRRDSRRGRHHEPVHQTRRIDGTVRPPEFKGTAENDVWDRVMFIDQLGGAVRQMGF